MSATIITFPGARSACATPVNMRSGQPDVATAIGAVSIATKFTDHFLPVVQASMDLLEADEADFEARCRSMLDADGTTLIDELCEEFQIVGRQMELLVEGLDLTRTRLRTAMARLSMSNAMVPETVS